ncbi:MAG: hypothetical protein K0R02_486 [Rickettsiaceae bacterium]|nr:hypothetical protein [Rickettsiaceae bacterium]
MEANVSNPDVTNSIKEKIFKAKYSLPQYGKKSYEPEKEILTPLTTLHSSSWMAFHKLLPGCVLSECEKFLRLVQKDPINAKVAFSKDMINYGRCFEDAKKKNPGFFLSLIDNELKGKYSSKQVDSLHKIEDGAWLIENVAEFNDPAFDPYDIIGEDHPRRSDSGDLFG